MNKPDMRGICIKLVLVFAAFMTASCTYSRKTVTSCDSRSRLHAQHQSLSADRTLGPANWNSRSAEGPSPAIQTAFTGEPTQENSPQPEALPEIVPEPHNLPSNVSFPAELVGREAALTIEELESIALASNPTIRQAQAIVHKAQAVRAQVGFYPNPTIGYFGEELGDEGGAGKQGGFVNQTIVTAGKLGQSQEVADRDVQGMLWQLEAQRYRVRNAVRSQFYETLGAQHRVHIARRLVEIAEDGLEASRQLFRAQQAAKPDLLQTQIQLNEGQIELRNAEYEYAAAWRQLASLVGYPELPPARLAGSLEQERNALGDFGSVLTQLLVTSPEIHAAHTRVARARAQIRRQQIQPIPNLLAQVGVAHNNVNGSDIANVQLGVPLPIFNRNEGSIQLAVAELHRAISDLERLELSLEMQLATAYRDYQKALNQVEQYRNEILPIAQENLDLTEEGYRQGEFDLLRALTARRSYFQTNLAYVNSQVALRKADVAITGLLLSGGLDQVPDDIGGNLQGIGLREEALSGQ